MFNHQNHVFGSVPGLPNLGVSATETTISGFSSGAFMTAQLHVTFSETFKGAGVLAGGPFFCAQDDGEKWLYSCTTQPENIPIKTIEQDAQKFSDAKSIDPISTLKDQPVWLWSGTKDTIVYHGVENATDQFYRDMGADVVYVNDMEAEHGFPTDLSRNKNTCMTLDRPGISNCHYDGVGEMFKHIIPN